jgi:DUF1009 family protein
LHLGDFALKEHPLPSTLGLIAGEGRFPFMVLAEAKRRGLSVVTLGIEGEADEALESECERFEWIGIGEVSRCVRTFRDANVSKAIMAGRVRHVRAFQILKPDRLMLKVLARLPSRSTDAMLKTLADVLAEAGVELLDSTLLLTPFLATDGAMTKRKPNKEEMEDIEFGAERARGLAALDIGQTVVVKRKSVVGAEAMEGTDETIRRAGQLVTGPLVVVKVARPSQDMRFDVPVVGPTTIDSMVDAGASALALEAGRVLLVERDQLLEKANDKRIAVHGFAHGSEHG